MSWQASAWAQRCHVGNGTAKAVLLYLADKAQPDGTGARPKIDTICSVVEFKRRAVINALRLLESRGFIRRGDQRLARLLPNGRIRPEQYAQVVWDLAVDRDPEVLSYIERVGENDTDPVDDRTVLDDPDRTDPDPDGAGSDGRESSGAFNARLGNGSQRCTRCTSRGAPDARPEVHEMHPSYKEQPSDEPPEGTNNPSAPTGHRPAAGGATPGEGTADDGMACEAGRVLDGLARLRRGLGLSVREPSKTDGRAVARLLRRLRDRGSRDPSGAVLMVLGSAFEGSWWPRLIRTGRTLESNWDKLADDATLSARRDAGTGPVRPAAGLPAEAHAHSASCSHVAAIVDSSDAVAVEPSLLHRHGAGGMVAGWLNDGMGGGEALKRLCSILKDSAEGRRRDRERLERIRASRGGRMFAGAMDSGIEVTR